MPNSYCWFDVTIGGKPLKERIIMELFDDIVPKTCKNFRQLCLGNDGKMVEGLNVPMTYKNSTFHRVIARFMIQGGDFTNHNGTGGVSIYGEKFEDENFQVPCKRAGLLAMANAGTNTNGSQFFITTDAADHLTGRHVVFGQVVRGMNSVRAIEHTPTGTSDKPLESCTIVDCGVLDVLPEAVAAVGGDMFPDYPEDAVPLLTEEQRVEAGEAIRLMGNELFKAGSFTDAIDKYAKAIRYLSVNITSANSETINPKLVACYNNMAVNLMRIGEYSRARDAATEVLNLDPHNSKALFRRGSSALSTGDDASAVTDLTAALALEPNNAEIAEKLKAAKDVQKARQAKMAAGLKKMFS